MKRKIAGWSGQHSAGDQVVTQKHPKVIHEAAHIIARPPTQIVNIHKKETHDNVSNT